MSNFKTEQEKFWAEDFGNDYVDRNSDLITISKNASFNYCTVTFSR